MSNIIRKIWKFIKFWVPEFLEFHTWQVRLIRWLEGGEWHKISYEVGGQCGELWRPAQSLNRFETIIKIEEDPHIIM